MFLLHDNAAAIKFNYCIYKLFSNSTLDWLSCNSFKKKKLHMLWKPGQIIILSFHLTGAPNFWISPFIITSTHICMLYALVPINILNKDTLCIDKFKAYKNSIYKSNYVWKMVYICKQLTLVPITIVKINIYCT